jgi:murein DD-endopeptidase MepM/ murein hydrolase activator NlpD
VARYSLQGTEHFGILYQNPEAHRDYFDLKGKSLRKTLLKSPLSYRRISSKYSKSRLHPILKIRRPHYGVDYTARTGTPVVAAGDGRVIYKGWKRDYGKTVIIRHALEYQTYYGHLSRFAKKLSKGTWVKQGQVIGYVGSTGLSTGPHLDYRVKKGGKHIDPLKMVPPSVAPVQQKFMQDYLQVRDEMLLKMQSMAGNDKVYVSKSEKDQ